MERKVVSDKTRLLRGFLVLVAMLAGGTIAGWTNHETFRFWLKFTFVPLTVGGCIAFLVMYFAMRIKKRVLRMPEGF